MERAGLRSTELKGTWLASPADEDSRRTYADDATDDSVEAGWAAVTVPGHWRTEPSLAERDGPVLYRTRFEADDVHGLGHPDSGGVRRWLTFDGIFYTSDVWLDGSYLGDTEGYFVPHAFEVTDLLSHRSEHLLALEVACNRASDRRRKRNLTGVFQHSEILQDDWNPGGIWRPVRIVDTGPVRIRHSRILCDSATDESAVLKIRVVLDAIGSATVALRTTVFDPDGNHVLEVEREQSVAAAENRIEWAVSVSDPQLWWPWMLGDQPRYRVVVEVLDNDVVSDRIERLVGLRQVAMRNWVMQVNGERLFLKGTNLGPTSTDLAGADPELVRGDIRLARDVGLDLVRVTGHVARPELYDEADQQGVLVWQDLPLRWGYARSVRTQARRHAREVVDLLGHHASVAVWCGHDDPAALDIGPDTLATARGRRRLAVRQVLSQALPTWNRTVLDNSIASELERSDRSRPVIAHSGVWPHAPQLDGTDSHLFLGWYAGRPGDLTRLARLWPRVARFVSAFGAQSVPNDADFLEPSRWPDLDWDRAWRDHGLQKTFFDRTTPPAAFDTFEAWRDATQTYQAELLRDQIEALRRLRFRPTGGFAQFFLADAHPAVSWSLLDHDRRPKPAWGAVRDACAPTIVTVDPLPGHLHGGEVVPLDVHVVNDTRIALDDMIVTAHLSWEEGGDAQSRSWSWGGEVPADSCVYVATLDLAVPAVDGEVDLEVTVATADDPTTIIGRRTRRSTAFHTPHTH